MKIKIYTRDARIQTISDTIEGFGRRLSKHIDSYSEDYHLYDGSALHRENGPAVVCEDGTEEYWYMGHRYSNIKTFERRKELSSYIDTYRKCRIWYKKGASKDTYHRDDGKAAVEYEDGSRYEWWSNGKVHRGFNQPAIVMPRENTLMYFVDGRLHRTNGPAIERGDGSVEYWLDDRRYLSEQVYYEKVGLRKSISDLGVISFYSIATGLLHREGGPAVIFPDGSSEWWQNGRLHRTDGPAITGANGNEQWYLCGERHREGGPAITHFNGDKEWWRDGERHRAAGPAIEYANGNKEWYMEGVLTKTSHDGHVGFYNKLGKFHRTDGPAKVSPNGDAYWLEHGSYHRINGPAIIESDKKEYWINNKQYSLEEYNAYLDKHYNTKMANDLMKSISETLEKIDQLEMLCVEDKPIAITPAKPEPAPQIKKMTEDDAQINIEWIAYNAFFTETESGLDKVVELAKTWTFFSKEERNAAIQGITDALSGYLRLKDEEYIEDRDGLIDREKCYIGTKQAYKIYAGIIAINYINSNIRIMTAGSQMKAVKEATLLAHTHYEIDKFLSEKEFIELMSVDKAPALISDATSTNESIDWGVPLMALAAATLFGLGKKPKSNRVTLPTEKKQVEVKAVEIVEEQMLKVGKK